MKLTQALHEIDTLNKLDLKSDKIELQYLDIDSDFDIKEYAENHELILHHPCTDLPYYWIVVERKNIYAVIRGEKKQVKLIL